MSAPSLPLTPEQLDAVTATGMSVLVSAAAGSGKTAVLAERCAYLVCDAPVDQRCDIDALLVLTYTEAAASEMRSRIVEAIRQRAAANPQDARLRQQLALADAAQIATIHAFCLWMIRRWFTDIDLDPSATVLDAEEAKLLRKDVLDGLFSQLYATQAQTGDLLGGEEVRPANSPALDESERSIEDWRLGKRSTAALGPAFIRLVDVYGLGEDREIGALVLRLHEFVTSLPDSRDWLRESVVRLFNSPWKVVVDTAAALAIELQRQCEHATRLAERIEAGPAVGHFYAERVRAYADVVRNWGTDLGEPSIGAPEESIARIERVRSAIEMFKFPADRAPSLPRGTDPAIGDAKRAASGILSKHVKERLFEERLRNRYARFSAPEMIGDLRRCAPYVATIVDLVDAFGGTYSRAKRRLNVVDFSDLEVLALRLLHGDSEVASPIGAALRRRFAHVLIDEFQDVSPVQQEILQRVSGEADSSSPGSLFTVGDVKQSIYRFRLAEPSLFADRQRRFCDGAQGKLIFLQTNFRSRPEILDAVNLVFRQLMREGLGERAVYDDRAELRPGRMRTGDARLPIELHVLEKLWSTSDHDEDAEDEADARDDDEDAGYAANGDPRRWSAVEREAYWIGSRILEWRRASLSLNGRAVQYRDIAILLRSPRFHAERVAAVLTGAGIPAYADVGGSLFGSREIRDVVAALEVLDNPQQDIPLVSILRSGVFGDRFSEDELVEIRCLDRSAAFHAAVRDYADHGQDRGLRARVADLWARIGRYREDVRRRPLAEVLWRLYGHDGYLAYAAGLPNGAQRRANLLKLHSLAQQFGAFRRQGLHRFLGFIRSLAEDKQDVAVAPSIGESEDVVRILSIHQAKGLEFPIVFVAGLGTKFNLGDRNGRMLFERRSHIGLRAIDAQRMLEYPTAAHRLVVDEIERTSREEEMRILYVAMTRARDRLVLVGSLDRVDQLAAQRAESAGRSPTLLEIATASMPLDWLLPALQAAPSGTVEWRRKGQSSTRPDAPLFEVHAYTEDEISAWRPREAVEAPQAATRRAVSLLRPLPGDEPLSPGDSAVEAVLARLEATYAHAGSTAVRATIAASEFRRDYAPLQGAADTDRVNEFSTHPSTSAAVTVSDAAHRGIVTHRVLQHLDFAAATDVTGMDSEMQRLMAAGVLTMDDAAIVDRAGLGWFVSTPLAERIRCAGADYRREFRYLATEPVSSIACTVAAPTDDRVLVRGIVDGILVGNDGLEVVDFKTDAIHAEHLAERVEHYRGQVVLYSQAMTKLWRRPVQRCWLVFLTARQVMALDPRGDERDA